MAVNKQDSAMAYKNHTPLLNITTQPSAIAVVTDALDGATLTGTVLTTSATPTVDELETAVGVLGGKVNEIITVLRAHGLIAG
jgi:hypothetical protein